MSIILLLPSSLSHRCPSTFAMCGAGNSPDMLRESGGESRNLLEPRHFCPLRVIPWIREPSSSSSGVKTLLLLRGRWDGREMVPSSSSSPSFHAGNLIKSSSLLHHCRRRRRLTQRPKPDCTLLAASPASLSLSLSMGASQSAQGCLLIQPPIQPLLIPFSYRQAVRD